MKNGVGTQKLVIHNGTNVFMDAQWAKEQMGPDNHLGLLFKSVDQALSKRLRYLLISPETTPDPKGFKYEGV